ncbi:MAG: hypothetical protein ACXV3C_03670 [Actinomycetes bacterium]
MSALAWLAIPVVALLLGVLWVMWASRERPRADTHDTVMEHERFKAAFEPQRRDTSRDSLS